MICLAMLAGLMPITQVWAAHTDQPPVTIQLKWKHQFQFAGYYAALEKGFYADEGLNVRLIEGGPAHAPVAELLDGKVDYAVADAGVLLDRAEGRDVKVLASIFQQSPQVLYTRDDIASVADLRGKRVMLQDGFLTIEVLAMLQHFGISQDDFTRQPIGDIEDLISGRTDGFPGYSANEAFMLRQRGIAYRMYKPRDYGIDFYGDTLITTGRELSERPERALAVRRASLRGWAYALKHPREIVELILEKYNSQHKSAEHLMFEAEAIKGLMLADVVPIGFSNPERWQHVADTFARQGMLTRNVDLDGLLYQPERDLFAYVKRHWLGAAVSVGMVLLLLLLSYTLLLRHQVRQRAEQLTEASREFERIIHRMQDTYYRTDAEGFLTWASPSLQSLTGYSLDELKGKEIASLWEHPEEQQKLLEALRQGGGKTSNFETRIVKKDGSRAWVSISSHFTLDQDGNMIGVEGMARDISDIKQAEAEHQQLTMQFQQAQKMESIGLLAGGIAHDFNNLLVGVMGNAELALLETPENSPLREYLLHIFRSSQRGADLVRQMLAYSGQGRFSMGHHNLNACIRDISELLATAISKKAEVSLSLTEPLPDIHCDRNQLTQLLMNLMTNASDALGGKAGEIHVRTGVRELKAQDFQRMCAAADLQAGEYVFVEVRDTGCGMDAQTQERIFDPFFTTKETGTGLGLAALLGIVKGHQGTLELSSKLGEGSCFTVYFPVAEPRAGKAAAEDNTCIEPAAPLRGTVLVVDDEPDVLRVAQRLLEREGLVVLTATDGEQGVKVFGEHADAIALVILDLTMPKMDGEQAFQAMHAINPDVPVLLSSGFSESVAAERMKKLGLAGFISKPYTRKNLLAEVVRRGLISKDLESAT